ncbi:GNAT family N-acetyltransferase [Duodenibacillus massiliensis]|uniref:GNAT family N-acetyltransferase n=1 Tax=Duodenibacillus massiliensis TaxID=1852381 RepID=UPI00307AFFB2
MHAIDITVREVTERKDKLIAELTALWEASVRATHTFLTPEGIAEIRGFVPQAFRAVAHLVVAERWGRVLGFAGVEGERLEMLFLLPEWRGEGLGRALLTFVAETYGVNEDNHEAVGFYEHMGVKTYKRTDTDEEGRPYPLLYMRRA